MLVCPRGREERVRGKTWFLLGRRGGVDYLPPSAEAHILLEGAAPRRTPRVRKNAWRSTRGRGAGGARPRENWGAGFLLGRRGGVDYLLGRRGGVDYLPPSAEAHILKCDNSFLQFVHVLAVKKYYFLFIGASQ